MKIIHLIYHALQTADRGVKDVNHHEALGKKAKERNFRQTQRLHKKTFTRNPNLLVEYYYFFRKMETYITVKLKHEKIICGTISM